MYKENQLSTRNLIRLLYVDDDKGGFILLKSYIEEIDTAEFDLNWINNYEDAVLEIKTNSYDVYIFDNYIGYRTGTGLFCECFNTDSIAPVIILTDNDSRDQELLAIEHGLADYIDKDNLSPPQLERCIRYAIKQSKILESLADSRQFFQSTLDSLPSHIVVLDQDGTIIAVNEAWCSFARVNGFAWENYGIGRNYLDVCGSATDKNNEHLIPLEGIDIKNSILEVIEGKRDRFEHEYPCHSPDERRWFLLRANRFITDGPPRVIISHDNITKRKLAEEAKTSLLKDLNERGKELKTLHQTSLILQDDNLSVNNALQEITEILPAGFCHPELTAVRVLFGNGEFRTDNYRQTRWVLTESFKDSRNREGIIEAVLLEDKSFIKEESELLRSLAEIIKNFINNRNSRETLRSNLAQISKMHRYEEIIKTITQSIHSSIDLDEVLNNAVSTIVENVENTDDVSIYVLENHRAVLRAQSGYPDWYVEKVKVVPEPQGKTWAVINEGRTRYVPDAENDDVMCEVGHLIGTRTYLSVPIITNNKVSGCIHIHSFRKNAFRNQEIKLFELVTRQIEVAFTNASIAESLKESKTRYREMFNSNPHPMWVYDLETLQILEVNEAAVRHYGYSRDEFINMTIKDLRPAEDIPRLIENIKNVTDGLDNAGIWRHLKKDGTVINVEITSHTLNFHGRSAETVMAYDITERLRYEERIRQQAELLDKARDAITVRDMDGMVTYWNKSAERLYGWSSGEVLGRNITNLIYSREKKDQYDKSMKAVISKGEWQGELRHLRKDSKEIIVDSSWTLVSDDEGNPSSILVVNTDITEKKNYEAQLLRAQRLESIGTLAGGIAHDINNVLQPIILSAELLRNKMNDPGSASLFEVLDSSTKRASDLVSQILNFSKGLSTEKNIINPKYILKEINTLLKQTLPRSIEIVNNITVDLHYINCDSTKIHQVIMNLCLNARDAMPDGGTLTISAENFHADRSFASANMEISPGDYVTITVADNGTGISEDIIDRIFEPFFTTKEVSKGTGLGLSTAYGIVSDHGGIIKVYSEVGRGSEFRVYLPSADITENLSDRSSETDHIPRGNGEMILVVDDEDAIRETARLSLEEQGYRVISANDGAEAIAVYKEHENEIRIIIMDLMMPVLSGNHSLSILKKMNEHIRIIVSTGLKNQLETLERNSSLKPDAVLLKPYTIEELLSTVHKVLN